MTDSFGTRLRHAREQQHISIADIAARTKIKASLFEELERDDASRWPSGIFRRSFMREYAHAVGLNAEETVREFLRSFPDPADAGAEGTPRDGAANQQPPVRRAAPLVKPRPAVVHSPAGRTPVAAEPQRDTQATALRLTLVETGMPFTGGRVLAEVRRRWYAAAWDLGSVLAIALSVFIVVGHFWMPFALGAACYYLGGVLLLGNSPGVCLFAPRPRVSGTGSGTSVRTPRSRHADALPSRHGEPSFRARRWPTRRSEAGT